MQSTRRVLPVGSRGPRRGRELPRPDVPAFPVVIVRSVRGVRPARQRPWPVGQLEDGQAVDLQPVGVEVAVVVDDAVVVEPLATQHLERLLAARSDLAVERLGGSIRPCENGLSQHEQQAAPDEAEAENRERRPVQADPAGLHDGELARPGQQSDGHQRRHESRDRQNVVDELRRRVPEVPQQHRARRLFLEQLVGQVDERGDVEDPEQSDERKAHPAQVRLRNVPVEDVDARERTGGHRDDGFPVAGATAVLVAAGRSRWTPPRPRQRGSALDRPPPAAEISTTPARPRTMFGSHIARLGGTRCPLASASASYIST